MLRTIAAFDRIGEENAFAVLARAVLLGRPIIWGLTVQGADGVKVVLDYLRDELVRAMQLTGTANLKEATPDLLAPH